MTEKTIYQEKIIALIDNSQNPEQTADIILNAIIDYLTLTK